MKLNSDRRTNGQESVARKFCFGHLGDAPESEFDIWWARAEHLIWILQQPHDDWYHTSDPSVLPTLMPKCTWGEDVRIHFRTVERNYFNSMSYLIGKSFPYQFVVGSPVGWRTDRLQLTRTGPRRVRDVGIQTN